MALDLTKLSAIARGRSFTLWHYDAGGDTAATIDSNGYFSGGVAAAAGATDFMRAGDIIIALTSAGAAIGFFFVNQNSGGTIDTADVLALTVTDTD